MLRRALSTAALVLATPQTSLACSVCMSGTSDNRIEFILTTALLTFLPMLLIGGVVYGLRRRYLSLSQQATCDDVPHIPRHDAPEVQASS